MIDLLDPRTVDSVCSGLRFSINQFLHIPGVMRNTISDDAKLNKNENMENVLEITHKLKTKAKTKVENAWVTSQEAFLYSYELEFLNAYGAAKERLLLLPCIAWVVV